MSDIYVIEFGDDDERNARAEERRVAEARRRARYAQHLVETVGIDEITADLAVAALFDHAYPDGQECHCGCHPRLSEQHDDGFDCPCSWDEARRADEQRKWRALFDKPEFHDLEREARTEEREIGDWVARQPGVEATRSTAFAPEQWEGTVDGHSFYFRERHGAWRIELDLAPNGRFAKRFVEWDDNGEMVTEPVPIEEGEVIAEGIDTQLGTSPIDHITFIVQTIRDHLFGQECAHQGALFFCPVCGKRMDGIR